MGENYKENKIEHEGGFSDLIIYTSTLYKGDSEQTRLRKDLAIKTFENAEQLNIKCIVIDGGSDQDFIDDLKRFKNVIVEENIDKDSTMGADRRLALEIAMKDDGAKYFLWIEPEKYGLIEENTLNNMIALLRSSDSDLVVPKREDMSSMPKFQEWEEKRANKRIAEGLSINSTDGKELDLFFGPKMFNRNSAHEFLEYNKEGNEKDLWDSIIKPVALVKEKGYKISSVDVPYEYDDREKKLEEEMGDVMKKKRVDQYGKVLAALGDKFWENKINPKDKN